MTPAVSRGSALLSFAMALAIGAAPAASRPGRAAVGEMSLNALALRADGTPAADLSADDFEIRIDGQPVPITACVPNDRPLRVVLLIDVSASMRMGDVVSGVLVQRAVDQWFPYGLQSADSARIGTIGKRLFLSEPFTSDHRDLLKASFDARASPPSDRQGPSPIWDAIDAAVTALAREDGVRAILVMTDGRATGNRVGFRDVTAHTLAAGVSVHVVAERDTPTMVPQADGTAVTVAPGLNMRAIADMTGGTYVSDRPFPWSDPGPLFGRALTALHHGYVLRFRPGISDGRVHVVDVRAKAQEVTVRARRSVIFPTD